MEGLVFALDDAAAADFTSSGKDENNGWRIAFDKFYNREQGAARDYLMPTGSDAIKNFKKKVVQEVWPQLDKWCRSRVDKIIVLPDSDSSGSDDEIPGLEPYEKMAMQQWKLYQDNLRNKDQVKVEKERLQIAMKSTEQGLAAMPPSGVSVTPGASSNTTTSSMTRLTFAATGFPRNASKKGGDTNDSSDEDFVAGDNGFTTPMAAFALPTKKRRRIRKERAKPLPAAGDADFHNPTMHAKPPPAAGDADFSNPTMRGVPFGISFDNISKEMQKLHQQFMGQDVFKENFAQASNRDKRENLRSLYEAIQHHEKMGNSDRVKQLTKRADELENELFRM